MQVQYQIRFYKKTYAAFGTNTIEYLRLLRRDIPLLLLLTHKRPHRDPIQPHHRLIRIPHQHILPLPQRQTHIRHTPYHPPPIAHPHIQLPRKLPRAHPRRAQHHMPRIIPRAHAAHVPHLEDLGACQERLDRPARELGGVVLHLGGDDRAALAVELRAPVGGPARFGLVLVQRADRRVPAPTREDRVHLRAHHDLHVLLLVDPQIELPIPIPARRERLPLLGRVKRVRVAQIHVFPLIHALEAEVLVDKGRFEAEVERGVEGLAFGGGRVGGVFVDGDGVEGPAVALVEEEGVFGAQDDDVPGVDGARGAHEDGEDRVGGVDPHRVGGLLGVQGLDHGVVRRRGVVLEPVQDLQRPFALGRYPIV